MIPTGAYIYICIYDIYIYYIYIVKYIYIYVYVNNVLIHFTGEGGDHAETLVLLPWRRWRVIAT